jgi:DNA-binding NarL/FixJ family response regulator
VETLELLPAGKRTSSMARRLGISEVTVTRHVSELVRKLRVRDRRTALERLDEVYAQLFGRRAPSQDG